MGESERNRDSEESCGKENCQERETGESGQSNFRMGDWDDRILGVLIFLGKQEKFCDS